MELVVSVTVEAKDRPDAVVQLEAIHYALRDLPGVQVEPLTLDQEQVDEDLDPLRK